jgi:hypothetical protein
MFRYVIGIWSLLGLYLLTFAWYRNQQRSLRLCLIIRESYLKNSELLNAESPFRPLKGTDEVRFSENDIGVDNLYFLPTVTLLVALANTLILFSF